MTQILNKGTWTYELEVCPKCGKTHNNLHYYLDVNNDKHCDECREKNRKNQ